MTCKKALPLLCFAVAGCAVEQDRSGYAGAWYYERLTPYHSEDLALKPPVHLRAVRELVGVPIILEGGSQGHADVFRDDIELFFAEPVVAEEERINLIESAVIKACPRTDLLTMKDRIAFFNDTYVVLQNVPCRNGRG